ncbi:MAG: phenylalanine--tRNA ligase subunit beta [Candidatus Dojkabacteria bacterium]
MKLPVSSIKEFTDLDITLEELLEILSTKIGEVEGYKRYNEMYEGIYIAEILSKKDHPEAQKLAIYQITIGQDYKIQVVAGDKALEVGDKVAYIKPGNIVPSTYATSQPFEIKEIKMRGVRSSGMLCSEKELDIGQDNSRVLKLDKELEVGKTFAEVYNFNDTVVEIENKALTNRADLFGILGLAREISAAKSKPFLSPQWYLDEEPTLVKPVSKLPFKITNSAQALCPRYVGLVIDDVEIADSPIWLKSILLKCGIKPINNVVDITNYIAILTGQPMHAFDYDKVKDGDIRREKEVEINIRMAREGESITTLENTLVQLDTNTLVIADSSHPIAIAGIIGGKDTEIDRDTKRVILECANFDRFNIRKSSMSLGINTEASTRFTKALDPNHCLAIITYTAQLINELAQGNIASDTIDIYPEPLLPKKISLSISTLNNHLGSNLSKEEILTILTNIEYKEITSDSSDEYISLMIPSFRMDISIPEDIHEDVGRIYGYNNIKPLLPKRELSATKRNKLVDLKSQIRDILSNSGANEIDTYSFVGVELVKKSNQDPNLSFVIKNALSPELSLMRTSLLTSMLSKAQENIERNIPTFALYEFNIAHQKGNMDNFQLPKEQWNLALLFTSKESKIDGNPYYQVKRYLEKIFTTLKINHIEYLLLNTTSQEDLPSWIKNLIPTFNPKSSAYITHKGKILGVVGELADEVKRNFKLPTFTAGLEIDLESLVKIERDNKVRYQSSKYPAIVQDITLSVDRKIEYKEIEKIVSSSIDTRNRFVRIECLDIYSKDDENKNITIRISVEHQEKTLSTKELNKIVEKIILKVGKLG